MIGLVTELAESEKFVSIDLRPHSFPFEIGTNTRNGFPPWNNQQSTLETVVGTNQGETRGSCLQTRRDECKEEGSGDQTVDFLKFLCRTHQSPSDEAPIAKFPGERRQPRAKSGGWKASRCGNPPVRQVTII